LGAFDAAAFMFSTDRSPIGAPMTAFAVV